MYVRSREQGSVAHENSNDTHNGDSDVMLAQSLQNVRLQYSTAVQELFNASLTIR